MDEETRIKVAELIRNNPDLEVIVLAENDEYLENTCSVQEITSCCIDQYVWGPECFVRLGEFGGMVSAEEDLCSDHFDMMKYIYPEYDWDEIEGDELIAQIKSVDWKTAIFIICSSC